MVGRGYHTWAGVKHAEVLALEEAQERARGATLYVTLEPCASHGRTPPCIGRDSGGGRAQSGRAYGGSQSAGHAAADSCVCGTRAWKWRSGRAIRGSGPPRSTKPFVHFMRTGRPLVTLKAAVTLDGKIAAPEDNAGWITSETARAHVQTLRHRSDAILTGIGTVLADDCRLDRSHRDWSAAGRCCGLCSIRSCACLRIGSATSCNDDVLVVTTSRRRRTGGGVSRAMGVRVEVLESSDGRVSLQGVVELLAREKYLSLMIEAGSRVNWSALESGVADKIFFYYAPKILGGMQSLPVAGGAGRRRRKDAIRFRDVKLHSDRARTSSPWKPGVERDD